MGQQTVNVTMPNGTATIPNPLFAYNFHPVIANDFVYNPVSCTRFADRLMECALTTGPVCLLEPEHALPDQLG